ncbi:MAG: alpha/beta hydrolase-fold protein [Myxococcota bacterium]
MLRRATRLRGRVERFALTSEVLRGNALGDPARRDVVVYLPPEYDRSPDRRFPVFVDLVGFMGSGAAHVAWKAFDESVPQRLERLVHDGRMGPVIAVFPDCWTRLGGNQYINSSAVGRYADYLVREVVPAVDARYRTEASPQRRALFGKSSGGYGAIVHGMRYARHWGAVACHSGDMFFEVCYRADVPKVCNVLARHGGSPRRFLRAFYAKRKPSGADMSTLMFLAMAAFYDPDPDAPLGFHLPMDVRTAVVDEARWRRWRSHDPIRLVERKRSQEQLDSLAGIFIDCGTSDQFQLHFGARLLHDRLLELGISHQYQEFPDNHSGIDYRMDESLPWLYRRVRGR